MTDSTYHVYFTNGQGQLEFYGEVFHSKMKAKEIVMRLIAKGYDDAGYEGFVVDIRGY